MTKKIKYFLSLFTLAFVALVLGACGPEMPENSSADAGSEVAATSEDGDTLVIGLTNNIDTLNPFNRSAMASSFAQRFIFESLLSRVSAENFEPRLGTLETEDNQTYTITVHEDAMWSDGVPVTTKDVEYTINATAHPDTLTSQATHISMLEGTTDDGKLVDGAETVSGMEVVDDKTMTVTTKTPVDMGYMSEFFGYNFLIAPEHVYGELEPSEIHMSEVASNPQVTNGAYTFVKNADGDYLELVKNPNYHRGEPKIEKVFMKIVDSSTAITDLLSGEIHMMAGGGVGVISLDDLMLLEENEDFIVEGAPGTGIEYAIPNMRDGRFDDVRSRQALGYAINRDLAVENILHGDGEVPAAPYTSYTAYHNEEVEPYPYNPEKARELLEEANFDFENPVRLMVAEGNSSRNRMADLVQQDLEAIGLNIVQENYDIATWISNAREGEFDIAMVSMAHSYDPNVATGFHSTGPTNMGAFSDEKIDELIVSGNNGLSFDERYPYYAELQEEIKDKVPALPLYAEYQYKVQVKNLEGGVDEVWIATTANIHEWEFTE